MPEPTRRNVLAWSAPVIASAVAAPLAASSQPPASTMCVDPNGTYEVTASEIIVRYRNAPDIYELNVRGPWGTKSFGTNYGTAPARGSKVWRVSILGWPDWVQCHSMDAHYGESTCPARGGHRV